MEDSSTVRKVLDLLERLDNHDDERSVSSNVSIPDEALARIGKANVDKCFLPENHDRLAVGGQLILRCSTSKEVASTLFFEVKYVTRIDH